MTPEQIHTMTTPQIIERMDEICAKLQPMQRPHQWLLNVITLGALGLSVIAVFGASYWLVTDQFPLWVFIGIGMIGSAGYFTYYRDFKRDHAAMQQMAEELGWCAAEIDIRRGKA